MYGSDSLGLLVHHDLNSARNHSKNVKRVALFCVSSLPSPTINKQLLWFRFACVLTLAPSHLLPMGSMDTMSESSELSGMYGSTDSEDELDYVIPDTRIVNFPEMYTNELSRIGLTIYSTDEQAYNLYDNIFKFPDVVPGQGLLAAIKDYFTRVHCYCTIMDFVYERWKFFNS